jgi:hypothetical protein
MRNQIQPIPDSLTPGETYTWAFQTTTHMGIDSPNLTQRLVWQIHDNVSGSQICSPLTVLGIQNFGGPQVWYLASGAGTWTGTYTEGATDAWRITALVSNAPSGGHIIAYRNSVKIMDGPGPTYNLCSQNRRPWWNFGPYMWDWARSSDPSILNSVEILFDSMVLRLE